MPLVKHLCKIAPSPFAVRIIIFIFAESIKQHDKWGLKNGNETRHIGSGENIQLIIIDS